MPRQKMVEKTTKGLAGALFEELELLRQGKSSPQQAKAKVSIANSICSIARLEMEYSRFVEEQGVPALSGNKTLRLT